MEFVPGSEQADPFLQVVAFLIGITLAFLVVWAGRR